MMPGLGRRRLTWRDLPEAERAHAAGRELRKRPLAASVANPFATPTKRKPKPAPPAWWQVRRVPGGRLAVVSHRDGRSVMDGDALQRLENAYLIASAPEIRDALDMVANRFATYLRDNAAAYSRDARMVEYALSVLASVAPPWEERQRAQSAGAAVRRAEQAQRPPADADNTRRARASATHPRRPWYQRESVA